MKQCSRCRELKPYEHYNRNRTRADGYSQYCKACHASTPRKPNCACEVCGKDFYRAPCEVAKGNGRYCSKPCMGAGRDKRLDVLCPICGKVFTIHAYEASRVNYCSRTCGMRSRNGERGPRWKGGEVQIACQWCGNTFSVRAYRVGRASFCSQNCKGQWQSVRQSGANHPLWRGGYSRADYPRTFNRKFQRQIRQRDSYTCQLCGKPGKDVHHINYNKAETTPENCITLCKSCHSKAHHPREKWPPILYKILKGESDATATLPA